jgi:hypothetical protein
VPTEEEARLQAVFGGRGRCRCICTTVFRRFTALPVSPHYGLSSLLLQFIVSCGGLLPWAALLCPSSGVVPSVLQYFPSVVCALAYHLVATSGLVALAYSLVATRVNGCRRLCCYGSGSFFRRLCCGTAAALRCLSAWVERFDFRVKAGSVLLRSLLVGLLHGTLKQHFL